MKLKLSIILVMTIQFYNAFAGDGGYSVRSCTSSSGRSVLSVFFDNYSMSEVSAKVRLIVDGQMAEYIIQNPLSESKKVKSPKLQFTTTGFNIIEDKSENVLSVDFVKDKPESKLIKATVKAGFKDPRVGTVMEGYMTPNTSLNLKCVEYFREP